MKKQDSNAIDAALLRQKAEEQLKLQQLKSGSKSTESDLRKLVHELEVLQIELQMINEELFAAKEKAELAEEKYSDLYAFAPTGLLTLTKQGKITELNFMTAAMLGSERLYLINKRFDVFVSDDSKTLCNKTLNKAFNSSIKESADISLIKNGRQPVFVHLSCIQSETPGQYLVTLVDITERKLAEMELIKSENELKKAQQITHIGSWYLDMKTNEVKWTEELYKMYGFDPKLPPPPYTEHQKLFTPESWELLSSSLANTRVTGIPYELELKTVRNDGSNGWMWVRGETVTNSDGKTIGLWGAAQDITKRKELERNLQESKDYLDKIINSVASPIFVKNDKHEFHHVNDAFCKLLNLPADKLIGHTDFEYLPEEQVKVFIEKDQEVFKTGRENINEERLTDGKGVVRTLITHKTLYTDNMGNKFLVGVTNDITELKKTEIDLRTESFKLNKTMSFFNDREGRMVALKREVNELCLRLGEAKKYENW